MKNALLLCTICFLISQCGSREKSSVSGEEPVEKNVFLASFSRVSVPYSISDSSLLKPASDSDRISYTVLSQFLPDSVLQKSFGKKKPRIFPLAALKASDNEHYLIIRTISGNQREAFVIAMDGDDNFLDILSFLKLDNDRTTGQLSNIDKGYTIHKITTGTGDDAVKTEGKEVYGFNAAAGNFQLIMTEALDPDDVELINPIDTLPAEHALSGDYTLPGKNIVSIRDGRAEGYFRFFIHFEKNKGDCTGELKGEAAFRTKNSAVYRAAGDPCVLQFHFGKNTVRLEEVEGCGARRGLKCSFNATYTRKKTTKKGDKSANK